MAPLRGEFVYRARLGLFVVYALVSARFVLTSLSSGDHPQRIAILAWLLVCVVLVARRSLELILAALVLAPVVSYIGLLGAPLGIAAAFLPFSCASLVWIGHRVAAHPRDLREPPALAWIADCLGFVIVVKSVIALATPSLQNSVWRLATVPSDYPYSEMQAMNVGFYLASMLCLLGILTAELRVDAGERAVRLLHSAILLQLGVVTLLALAQAILGAPPLVRDGLHAPFVGLHEMGFYSASFTAFFAVATLARPSSLPLRALLPALAAAAAMLGASYSRSAWIATLLVVPGWVLLAGRRSGRLLLEGPALAAAAALLAAAGLSAGAPSPSPPRRERVLQGSWPSTIANRERLSLFEKAVLLAAERPLDGVGIGDFRITDDERTAALVGWLDPVSRRDHDAHNILLNLASEAGLGAGALFLLLAGGAAFVGVSSRVDAQPLAGAAGAAVATGLLCNLVNCVITWPWQALTYGVLLALALASAKPAPVAAAGPLEPPAAEPGAPARTSWPALLPLLPAMIGVLVSPWSVGQDDLLQRSRYGFLRWDWFPPGASFVACQPSCRVPIEAGAPVAAVRVRPAADLPRSSQLRLTVRLDGVTVASQTVVPPQGLVVSVPGPARESVTLELTTRHLWKSWKWGRRASETWVVDLLDVRGATLPPHSRTSSAGDRLPSRRCLPCEAA